MLQNLNTFLIYPYGKIVTEKKQLFQKYAVQAGITYQNPDSETYIDFTGVTLYLGNDPDHLYAFWLDQPVLLRQGVVFSFRTKEKNLFVSSACAPKTMQTAAYPPIEIREEICLKELITVFYQEKDETFSFTGETHSFWEFTYVDSGILQTTVEGNTYLVKKGECILYAPQQYHTQKAACTAPVSFLTITFICDIGFLTDLSCKVTTVSQEVLAVLEQLLMELRKDSAYKSDMLISYVKQLLIYLYRGKTQESVPKIDSRQKRMSDHRIVAKVEEYVQAHLYDKLTIRQLAAQIPISPSYLSTIFKKQTNMPLTEYINEKKIRLGATLLQSGKYSITDTAFALSFSSVYYFSKVFKKVTGLTPGEYTKTLKE